MQVVIIKYGPATKTDAELAQKELIKAGVKVVIPDHLAIEVLPDA